MPTINQGQTLTVTAPAGRCIAVAAPGEALIRMVSGPQSSGYESIHLKASNWHWPERDVPFQLSITAVAGAVEYTVEYPVVASRDVAFTRDDSGDIDGVKVIPTGEKVAIGSSGPSSVAWGSITGVPTPLTAAQAAGTASIRAIGTTATTAAAGNHTHSAATTSAAGFMSAADKVKLNAITPTAAPTITVPEVVDDASVNAAFNSLISALQAAGIFT